MYVAANALRKKSNGPCWSALRVLLSHDRRVSVYSVDLRPRCSPPCAAPVAKVPNISPRLSAPAPEPRPRGGAGTPGQGPGTVRRAAPPAPRPPRPPAGVRIRRRSNKRGDPSRTEGFFLFCQKIVSGCHPTTGRAALAPLPPAPSPAPPGMEGCLRRTAEGNVPSAKPESDARRVEVLRSLGVLCVGALHPSRGIPPALCPGKLGRG